MKTIIAICGAVFLVIAIAGYAITAMAQPVGKCYDQGATAEFPRVVCDAGALLVSGIGARLNDDLLTGTINLAAASAQYVLENAGDPYIICARGNRAYVECGAAGVVVIAAAGGYTFSVPDGACIGPVRLAGPNCAHIAVGAVGQIEFLHIEP